MPVSIDLDRARRNAYEKAYEEFDSLDVDPRNPDETYAALQKTYDESLSGFIMKHYLDGPTAEYITVVRDEDRFDMNSAEFCNRLNEAMGRAIKDVFDKNRSQYDSLEEIDTKK